MTTVEQEVRTRAGATAPAGSGRARIRRGWRDVRSPLMFLAPFGALFLLTYVAPIVYAVKESLFKLHRSGLGLEAPTSKFNGLGNYVDVLKDSEFVASVGRVALFGVVQVPVMLGLALILALILDARSTPLKRGFRLAFFLPYAVPGVVGALMWAFLYEPDVTPLAGLFGLVGLHPHFTSDAWLPWSIGNIVTWAWAGYNMLIIHSALKAIPEELTEAAQMDGCTGWRLAWHVKVPLVRPALVMTAVFSIIGTAQLYNEPVVMRAVAPNLSSTWTPIMAAQGEVAANNYPLAATQSVVLATVVFVLSMAFMRFVNRKGDAL